MAQIYDRENLQDAEEHSSKPGSSSASTARGESKYTSNPRAYQPESSSTSTSPGKLSYDSSSNVPASERSLYNSSSTTPGKVRLGNFAKHRRNQIIAGGIFSTIVLGLPIALFLLLGAYKLHHLSIHLEQRLARSAREFNQNADKVLEDKVAIDAGDTTAADLASKSVLGKSLDLINPERVVNRMQANGVLDFQYTKGKLTSVVIDGTPIDAPQLKLGRLFSNRQAKIDFYNRLYSKVDESLRDTTSYQIRSRVGKAIIAQAGGHLYWWQNEGASEAGETLEQAELDEQLKLFEYVDTQSGGAITDGVRSAAENAYQDAQKCLEDKACATNVLEGQQTLFDASGAGSDINNYANRVLSYENIGGNLSAAYSILLPACIIYDGSVETSQAVVDAQNSAAVKAYLAITSADSQSISGGANGTAVGAFNKLLGNISGSNPEKLARGEPIDTTTEPNAQATRGQEYSIFGNIAGSSIFTKIKGLCGQLLSPEAIALALGVEICVAVCTGFEGAADEATLREAATAYINHLSEGIWERFLVAKEGFTNNALKFVFKNSALIGGTIGLTYMAKMLVTSEMGSLINGDQADYANTADQGGVVLNDELSRQQDFGRPMTAQETANSDVADAQYLNQQNANQSVYERYFALSNPDSLTSHEAEGVIAAFSQPHTIIDAFMHVPGELMSNFKVLSSAIFGHALAASSTMDTTHYNQVEWGWSSDEEKLINSDDSYEPLENAQILDASGKSDAIAQKYGPCYNDDIGTLLSTRPSGDSNFYVSRDDNGNVTDQGLCSPSNLSYSSQDPLAADPQSKQPNDLIFRWRLDQAYQTAANEFQDIQNVPSATQTSP